MKKYIAPKMDVANFNAEDIVTVSVVSTPVNFTEAANGELVYTSDYTQG